MILSAVIILISCMALSAIMIKRIIVHPVVIKMAGIALLEFAVMEYALILTNYDTLVSLDRTMYFALNSVNLIIPEISLIMNLGIALFFVSSVCFFRVFSKNKKLLLLAPIALFLFINHPHICEKLYIHSCVVDKTGRLALQYENSLKAFNIVIIIIYAILPYAAYIGMYFKTKLLYKRKTYIFSVIIIFLMDIVVYSGVIFGKLGTYFILNLNLLKYPNKIIRIDSGVFSLIYVGFMIIIIIVTMLRFKPFGKHAKRNVMNYNSMPMTVSMLLHGYKNAFVAIEMFSDSNNNSFLGTSEKRFERIHEIAIENEENIKRIIDVINGKQGLSLIKTEHSVDKLINKAICGMNETGDIRIDFNSDKKLKVFADEYHFREALICILNNAAEALHDKDTDKCISINTGLDGKDVYIEISDNGCGMSSTKNIFNPLYSSKNGVANFGIGLTYAREIIEAHNGIINIKSKKNDGTVVQIIINSDSCSTKKEVQLYGEKN